jgi:MFS-type transporter involved in bile tolerance (Atg22 family)
VEHGVTRDDWIVGGLALALLVTVLVFPWYHATVTTVNGPRFVEPLNRPAVQAPYAWAAIIAALALVVLLVDLGLQRWMPDLEVTAIGNQRRPARFVLAAIAVVFLLLKFLLHAGNLGWGFVLAVIVAVALLYTALQVSRGASAIPGH